MQNITASPLSWPMGQARTPSEERRPSAFNRDVNHRPTVARGRRQIALELGRMGVDEYVISTNLALRVDGEPRSGQAEPADPGVALYFNLDGRPTCLACDQWATVPENMRAIVKHIDALRGIERWGVGSRAQAFAGYVALPAPEGYRPPRSWREVMNFGAGEIVGPNALSMRYRELAQVRGRDEDALRELNAARDAARAELER